jgi:excisionase family DNA binding protein
MSEPRYASLQEAAPYARRSVRTLRRWIHDGRLPATRRLGRLEVDLNDLDAMRHPAHPNGARPGDATTTDRSGN